MQPMCHEQFWGGGCKSVAQLRRAHRHVAGAATEPVRLVLSAPALLIQPAETAGRVARWRHVLAHRVQVNCRGLFLVWGEVTDASIGKTETETERERGTDVAIVAANQRRLYV